VKTLIKIILIFILVYIVLTLYPKLFKNDKKLFEAFVFAPIPHSISNLQVEYTGGIDYTVKFYFEVEAVDLEKILTSHAYQELTKDSDQYIEFERRVLTKKFIKQHSKQDMADIVYMVHDTNQASIKYIACDKTRTKVICYSQNY